MLFLQVNTELTAGWQRDITEEKEILCLKLTSLQYSEKETVLYNSNIQLVKRTMHKFLQEETKPPHR